MGIDIMQTSIDTLIQELSIYIEVERCMKSYASIYTG